ncbi:MAG: S8 family serine peptidase, partial [Chloroflexota bacterium]
MKTRRYLLIALAPLALILSALLVFPGGSAPRVVYGEDAIPGRYIVVLNDNVDSGIAARAMGLNFGFESDTIYRHAVNGFAAEMSPQDAQQLAESDYVSTVVADQYVHTSVHENNFQTLPTGVDRIDADQNTTAAITGSPGPNLDVDVAVIDTGVISGHVDLNVAGGVEFIMQPNNSCGGTSFEDDHGHGTHVAGTIAAIDDAHGVTGVAPGARIWAVKVLDAGGNGSNSCVIAGIDWVTLQRQEFNDGAGDGDPGIEIVAANMSLGGLSGGISPADDPMCIAINSAVAAGVMFAVAAGNDGDDAANYSPAHCINAITVSAFSDFDGQPGALSSDTLT